MGIYNLGGDGGVPVLEARTVTPSTSQQIIKPSRDEYDGLSQVTVEATPLETRTVNPSTSSQTITPSGSNIGFSTVTVNPYRLQSKSVTPSASAQTVSPDSGYNGLSSVSVGGVSLQSKTVSPSSLPSTITQDSGYVGLSSVTIQKPSSLIPDNIAVGKSIFGVNGNSKIAFPVHLGGSRTDANTLVLHMYEDQAHSQSFSLPTGYNYLCIAGMNLEPQTAGGIGSLTISNFYYGGDWGQFYPLPMSSTLTYGLTGVNFFYESTGQFWAANTLTATIQSPFMTLTKGSDQYSFSSGTWNGTAILFGFN